MSMTVRELIAALSELPEEWMDVEVATEGCDCDGDVGSIETCESSSYDAVTFREVYLRRGGIKEETEYTYEPSEAEQEARTKGLLP